MTKPITIKDNIYERLTNMKNDRLHSFSDVIEYLMQKHDEISKNDGREKPIKKIEV